MLGCLLCEHAVSEVGTETDMISAVRWVCRMPSLQSEIKIHDECTEPGSTDVVFDGYSNQAKSKL